MARRKKNPSREQVKETFRKHYRRTQDWADAWNATLEELAGPVSDANMPARRAVGDVLGQVNEEVLFEEGDALQVIIEETSASLREDGALDVLEKEYDNAVAEITSDIEDEDEAESAIEEMEYPVMYLEFDPSTGEFQSWVIDHPQYYRGHAGPIVAIFPGMDIADVRREVGNTLADYDVGSAANPGHKASPRKLNANRRDVINAWAQGKRKKASALSTDGNKLYSYDLLIGERIGDKLVVYDYTGNNRISQTTTTHVNAAKGVADEVRSADERPGRYGNPMGPEGRTSLGAGLGSLGGAILGSIAGLPGAVVGSIGGGAGGGYYAAPGDRKKRGAIGGGVGGLVFGPIGSAVGGYIGGGKPDKKSNPVRKLKNKLLR